MSKYFHRSLKKKYKGGSFFTKPLPNGNNPLHQVEQQPPEQQPTEQQPPQPQQSSPSFTSPDAKPNIPSKSWFSWFFGDKVTNPFKSTVTVNPNEAKQEDHPRNAGGKQSKKKTHRKQNKRNKSYKRKTKN